MRIGEVIKAQRMDLLLPGDLLSLDPVVYIRINSPKSRNRGAKVQYATCREALLIPFFTAVWHSTQKRDRLFPYTASSFRRRWDALLKHLKVGQEHKLTPGSLRGGGAIHLHKTGTNIQELLWRMRLQHHKTLGYYLQEVTAVSILPKLSEQSRQDIVMLRDAFPALCQRFVQRTADRLLQSINLHTS